MFIWPGSMPWLHSYCSMKILIIEDEPVAARRLARHIAQALPEGEIVATLDSVSDSIEWFATQDAPDLIFMDIHLADGSSFDIFEEAEVHSPIIFTTAYDEYALQAFKTSSIDYLLKPIRLEDFQAAIDKWKNLSSSAPVENGLAELGALIREENQSYQQRVLIRLPQKIKAIDVKDVAYFFIESRLTFMKLKDGKQYPIDFNLDQMEARLHPGQFFRINRQMIVTFEAIENMYTITKSRLKLELKPVSLHEVVVASDRMAQFRLWLTGEYQRV